MFSSPTAVATAPWGADLYWVVSDRAISWEGVSQPRRRVLIESGDDSEFAEGVRTRIVARLERKTDSISISPATGRNDTTAARIGHQPHLVVLLLSPTEKPTPLLIKVENLLRLGVRLVWAIECDTRAISVFPSGRSVSVVKGNAALTGSPVFPAFVYHLPDLFAAAGHREAA
jgi:Uma2 family endonuclease